ncbi:DNA-binding transcriptional regulator, LacI/PurR family [Actinomyces ruminicola]|uniref:DNA-binding transcriptional regulator, LacI/PurR family n=1 Tax=Actinomyces ruminicola TaxID=332524 RepID=A0A1H0BGY2_9ACTO|nr:LacI family DNA-binding transcriptional regulator [Actinomyces ruminicola]SDN44683.1 DNA-binding transcriptional regulator, LacI/PurR family [Actinomyces ruminicola]
MQSSPTSRDVALAAGVSQSTVSYVLSGKRFVAPDTRARVRAAMDELGYRPHASARALKSSQSRILGLLVPYHERTDTPGQYRYIVSLAAACRRRGYDLLVISGEEGVEGMRRLVGSALCDGILVMDVLDDDARVDAAQDLHLPSVFIGLSHNAEAVVATDTDFEAIGAGCAQRIHDAGHRRALVVNPASEHVTPMGFIRRFDRALESRAEELGLALDSIAVPRGFMPTHAALCDYLARPDHADAFIVAPSTSIDDVINALLTEGLGPGSEVSVIGAGGSGDSSHTNVDYACYDSDVPRVADTAVGLLVDQLEGALPLAGREPERIAPVFHEGVSLRSLTATHDTNVTSFTR